MGKIVAIFRMMKRPKGQGGDREPPNPSFQNVSWEIVWMYLQYFTIHMTKEWK